MQNDTTRIKAIRILALLYLDFVHTVRRDKSHSLQLEAELQYCLEFVSRDESDPTLLVEILRMRESFQQLAAALIDPVAVSGFNEWTHYD